MAQLNAWNVLEVIGAILKLSTSVLWRAQHSQGCAWDYIFEISAAISHQQLSPDVLLPSMLREISVCHFHCFHVYTSLSTSIVCEANRFSWEHYLAIHFSLHAIFKNRKQNKKNETIILMSLNCNNKTFDVVISASTAKSKAVTFCLCRAREPNDFHKFVLGYSMHQREWKDLRRDKFSIRVFFGRK